MRNYAWKRKKDSVEEDDHLGIEDPKLCQPPHVSYSLLPHGNGQGERRPGG